jgi:hypothetical protein
MINLMSYHIKMICVRQCVTNTIYGNIDGVCNYIYATRSNNGTTPLPRYYQQRQGIYAAPVFQKFL